MHYSTLVAVDLPEIQEDPCDNCWANIQLHQLQRQKNLGDNSFMLGVDCHC